MSYSEYFDLYYAAQNKDCKYRAFLIDVKNSRKTLLDGKEYHKHHLCVDYIVDRLCDIENKSGKEILLREQDTIVQKLFGDENKHLKQFDNLKRNPMIVGDCACFLVNNNTITEKQFLDILCEAIDKFDINFAYHYLSAKYETNNYVKGNKQLCKQYVMPIMEDISKKDGLLIDKNCNKNNKNEENLL